MIRRTVFASLTLAIAAIFLTAPGGASATQVPFNFTGGQQNYSVPASVDHIWITAFGAQGGGYNPGYGGLAEQPLTLNSGNRNLQIFVGGQGGIPAGGWNGGGNGAQGRAASGYDWDGHSAGGGGASDVRIGGSRIMVAGGGGGGSGIYFDPSSNFTCVAGNGGGTTGDDAHCLSGGKGATQSAGGAGGVYVQKPGEALFPNPGFAGGAANGGNGGGIDQDNDLFWSGAGGGGGYYGGGGGAADNEIANGGGGGSSFVSGAGTTSTQSSATGNGSVSVYYSSIDSVQPNTTLSAVGEPLNISAQFGGPNPAGQMEAVLYPPQNPDCDPSGLKVFDGAMTASGGTFQSGNYTTVEDGAYRWVISYTGDPNYDDVSTPCSGNAGLVQVLPSRVTNLTVSPASPSNAENVTISGTSFEGATVSLYTNAQCSGTEITVGDGDLFRESGFPATVDPNSTTTFYASVANLQGTLCSTDSVTYVNDSIAPTASIETEPTALTNSPTATFTYSSSKAGSTFECKLDDGAYSSCPTTGASFPGLADGDHTFSVQATDIAGNTSEPVSYAWSIDTVVPRSTIVSKPKAISNSASATFTYSSDKPGSTFECSLDSAPFAACPVAGVSYENLADREHDFKVRATDPAGNVGPATATYSWMIDETLPQVTILSQPDDPTTSTTASFTYAADEQDSTYECALDAQAFASCPAAGTTLSNLSAGAHAFSVKATDAAGNTGPAASYGWTINPVTPPVPRANIGRVTVKGPVRVKQGRRAVYRIVVSNAGTATATGVKLTARGRGVNGRATAGQILAGSVRTLKVKVRPKRAGRVRLTFKVTSGNAGGKSARKTIMVQRKAGR